MNTLRPATRVLPVLALLLLSAPLRAGLPVLRIAPAADHARLDYLGWDSEGGPRVDRNLLRAGHGVELRVRVGGKWVRSGDLPAMMQKDASGAVRYTFAPAAGAEIAWRVRQQDGQLALSVHFGGKAAVEAAELVLSFDPLVTPTTVLPAGWENDGRLRLPAIISAPDHGQWLVTAAGTTGLKGRLEGSRVEHSVDFVVELPVAAPGSEVGLSLSPVLLPAPRGLSDHSRWPAARRGWFGALQCSAKWGDAGNAFSSPAGMVANNVVSDPASSSLWFYADQAYWTPELAPGVSAIGLVRRTLDWWLDEKVLPSGEMICYWDKAGFLDANSGPLIAAWDYVEATGDEAWLGRRIERLEFLADYLARRAEGGNGLVRARQSGNYDTLKEPNRSCAWFDALNCGGEDGLTNAIIYRGWRCLAELEGRLHRTAQAARYTRLADRLKAAYVPTLYNPATGWLAWWKSEDGTLHDYATPIVNGIAIEYGLVDPAQGREILARLRAKMREVGFTRIDLGVPPMLVPVRRDDYLTDAIGCPQKPDGSDTVGYYMNGGITAGQVLHFLNAHYVVGEGAEADRILDAMLGRQAQGGFQNGSVNEYPRGIDWTTWDGKPSGYEGYLADSFRFLQAVLLREPQMRSRLYRPLTPAAR